MVHESQAAMAERIPHSSGAGASICQKERGKRRVFSCTWTAMPKRVNYRFRHDPIKKETFAHGPGALGGLLLSPTWCLDHVLEPFSWVVPPEALFSCRYGYVFFWADPAGSPLVLQLKWCRLMCWLMVFCRVSLRFGTAMLCFFKICMFSLEKSFIFYISKFHI
jgi:hypothetical protein